MLRTDYIPFTTPISFMTGDSNPPIVVVFWLVTGLIRGLSGVYMSLSGPPRVVNTYRAILWSAA